MAHGFFAWNELMTNDVEAAKKFYAATFGWTYVEYQPNYCIFRSPPEKWSEPLVKMGGGFELVKSASDLIKYHVLVFNTENIEATIAKVVANGGKVVKPTWLIHETVGWQALFSDPEGNVHGIYKMAPKKHEM